MARSAFCVMFLFLIVFGTSTAFALRAEVREYKGSPTLFVNGSPTVPMIFYGWAKQPGPYRARVGTDWKEFRFSFTAPEDNHGECAIHIRFGTQTGALWIDDVEMREILADGRRGPNLVRFGDWEGEKGEIEKGWKLFVKKEKGARAAWALDEKVKHGGRRSCRVTVEKAGSASWHAHFYHSGLIVQRGHRYECSVWLKADRPRTVEIDVLRQGAPWTEYFDPGDEQFADQVRLAAKAGVNIVSFGIPLPWPKPDERADFRLVDETIDAVLRANPKALLIPRFGTHPPKWWIEKHPDDRMVFDDGPRPYECVASEAWRGALERRVRELVRHCEEKYGDHLLGYHPCGQHTGEWFYERVWEGRRSGFSEAMRKGFAAWLRKKYKTNAALRKAWDEPSASPGSSVQAGGDPAPRHSVSREIGGRHVAPTESGVEPPQSKALRMRGALRTALDDESGRREAFFRNVRVPTVAEREKALLGFFRDPKKERFVIDFHEYQQVAMAEVLERLARAIKEETRREKLVFFFYGYYFELCGLPCGPQTSGHLAMARMLRCPDVDVLCSPISYFDRGLGGCAPFMVAVDSVRRAGKLWLNEDDTRTYLTSADAGYGRVDTPEATHWVHQRNFAQILPRRLACWFMDLGGTGWLDAPDIWENIGRLRKIYASELNRPASWRPEVAVFVDERSPFYVVDRGAPLIAVSHYRYQLYRMGAPFAIYLLSDLLQGRVEPPKVSIFLGDFCVTPSQRKKLHALLRGKTVIWTRGDGAIDDATASAGNMSALTGFALRPLEKGASGDATFLPGRPLTEGLKGSVRGPFTGRIPLWTVEETKGVEPLARFKNGEIAAAARREGGALTIYDGTAGAPAKFLRNVLRAVGAHVYIDSDDVLLTDGRFLSLTATTAGEKRIVLPEGRKLVPVAGGKAPSKIGDAFVDAFRKGETKQYWIR